MRSSLFLALALAACGGSSASRPAEPAEPDVLAALVDNPAPCTAADLAGSWDGGEHADFESITIEADGTFMSYLHDRPFYVGAWTLADGTLELRAEGGTVITVADVQCEAGGLSGTSDGAPSRWARIR